MCSHKAARNIGIYIVYEQNEGNTTYFVSIICKLFGFNGSEARVWGTIQGRRQQNQMLLEVVQSCQHFQTQVTPVCTPISFSYSSASFPVSYFLKGNHYNTYICALHKKNYTYLPNFELPCLLLEVAN